MTYRLADDQHSDEEPSIFGTDSRNAEDIEQEQNELLLECEVPQGEQVLLNIASEVMCNLSIPSASYAWSEGKWPAPDANEPIMDRTEIAVDHLNGKR